MPKWLECWQQRGSVDGFGARNVRFRWWVQPVDATPVINHIYGGNIVIASHAENVSQLAHTNIAVGDITSLKAALTALGITNDGIKQLEANIEADKIGNQPTIGPKIKTWLANVGTYMSKEGAKAGVDVAKKLATKWLLQHYGLDTD